MNFSDTTALYMLIIANSLLLGAAALAVLKLRRQMRRFEQFWSSPTGASLLQQEPAVQQPRPQAYRHLERRVSELQSVVRTLASREQQVVKPVDGSLPIENAVRMARHGASIDELVRSCGLNIGEARLMQKLHSRAQEGQAIN